MSDQFGLKIGIEGEKEFKSALREIDANFKVLSSEMKLTQSQFEKNDQSMAALTARNQVLNKEIDAQKERLKLLKDALQNSATSFGENDIRTQNWTIKLNNAQAVLNGMEREVKQNESTLNELGNQTSETSSLMNRFKSSLASVAEAASDSDSKWNKLGGTLKAVSATLAATSTAITTVAVAAGKAIFDMAMETTQAGDEVDKMSQRLGLSREGYQKWNYAMKQSGIDINSTRAGMKNLTNLLDDASKGSKTATEMFTRLGYSLNDIQGKSQEEIFEMSIRALQNMSSETERAALANDLFGRSGQEMLPLLNTTAEATQQLLDRASRLGFVMSDEAVSAAVVFGDSLDDLKSAFAGVKNSIMGDLLPGFNLVVEGLIGLLTGGENAREKIKTGVAETIDSVREVLPQIKEVLLTIIDVAAEVIPEIVQAIVSFIVENLPEILKTGTEILLKLIGGILQAIPEITKQLPAVVTAIVEAMKAAAPEFKEIGKEIVRGIWQGILGLGAWLKEKMNDFFTGIVGGIKGLLGIRSPSKVFAGIGENMASGLGVGFSEQMKQVKKQLQNAIPQSNRDLNWNTTQSERTDTLSEPMIMVNVPLTLDGKLLTSSTGKVQFGRNQSYARALGVLPV
jgi:hypothetical protein